VCHVIAASLAATSRAQSDSHRMMFFALVNISCSEASVTWGAERQGGLERIRKKTAKKTLFQSVGFPSLLSPFISHSALAEKQSKGAHCSTRTTLHVLPYAHYSAR
jgi:hypothetical protein